MKTAPKFRFAEFVIAALVVLAVMVWIERTAWRQIDRLRLQLDDSALKLGSLVGELKSDILQHRLTEIGGWQPPPASSDDRLQTNAARLQMELSRTAAAFTTAQQALATRLVSAMTSYLEEMRSPPASRAAAFDRVLALCEEFNQELKLETRRQSSARNLALQSLQRVWFLSLMLVAAAGAMVVAVFYRRLLVSLRAQLSESRTHLERHEKLASLGVFAAGIAHEIRNPLTAIKVRLFSLKRSAPSISSVQDDVQVISDEINPLVRIVSDFLQCARPPELECRPVNVTTLVNEVGNLLEPQLARRSVQLVRSPTQEAWAQADSQKLKQVLINLIQNAGQSIEGEGTVSLRVRLTSQELLGRSTDAVAIEVTDTGKGMPPEVVKRLFDPFFTTKEDGTGLGLPIAARIVELHGGVIEYETQPQHGTTFRIVLPRIAPP